MQITKYIYSAVLLGFLFFGLFGGMTTLAQEEAQGRFMLDDIAEQSGLIEDAGGVPSLQQRIGLVINPLLGLVGSAFLALTIYAGVMWMTAAGNDQRVDQAKRILQWAVIGIAVTIFSYGIVTLLARALVNRAASG